MPTKQTKKQKFKVGDRVFYKYNGSEHTYGTIKTIDEKHKSFRSFGKTRYFPYNVLFDNGNCYWYSVSELQLLPKKKTVKRKTVKAWMVILPRIKQPAIITSILQDDRWNDYSLAVFDSIKDAKFFKECVHIVAETNKHTRKN